jgi:hypothetical protein
VCKPCRVVKGGRFFLLERIRVTRWAADAGAVRLAVRIATVPSATRPLQIVSFHLTPQDTGSRIPATFPLRFWSRGPVWEKVRVVPQGGDLCSICRVGPCSVLIRNAWLAATGCVPALPEANFAPTVTPRSTMSRRRWALACGCVLAHSVVTVPRVVPPGVRGSRRSRADWARSSRQGRGAPSPPGFLSAFPSSELKWNFDCSLRPIEQVPPSVAAASGQSGVGSTFALSAWPNRDVEPARKGESGRGAPAARGLGALLGRKSLAEATGAR